MTEWSAEDYEAFGMSVTSPLKVRKTDEASLLYDEHLSAGGYISDETRSLVAIGNHNMFFDQSPSLSQPNNCQKSAPSLTRPYQPLPKLHLGTIGSLTPHDSIILDGRMSRQNNVKNIIDSPLPPSISMNQENSYKELIKNISTMLAKTSPNIEFLINSLDNLDFDGSDVSRIPYDIRVTPSFLCSNVVLLLEMNKQLRSELSSLKEDHQELLRKFESGQISKHHVQFIPSPSVVLNKNPDFSLDDQIIYLDEHPQFRGVHFLMVLNEADRARKKNRRMRFGSSEEIESITATIKHLMDAFLGLFLKPDSPLSWRIAADRAQKCLPDDTGPQDSESVGSQVNFLPKHVTGRLFALVAGCIERKDGEKMEKGQFIPTIKAQLMRTCCDLRNPKRKHVAIFSSQDYATSLLELNMKNKTMGDKFAKYV